MSSLDNLTKGLLVGLAILVVFAIGLTTWVLIKEGNTGATAEVGESVAAVSDTPAVPVEEVAPIERPTQLPPAVIVELPTITPIPATDTPVPTDTPAATSTPVPTDIPTLVPPTNTAVYIAPTNTPLPPPTNTPVPATAAPQIGVNGLIATSFNLQDRSKYNTNGRIWFDFNVSNSSGGDVSYNSLGVMPRKNGADVQKFYQHTYGGPNARIRPGGLQWEDNIKINETGDYTLRLVICFDGYDACINGSGKWHSLSNEIPITIN